MKIECTIKRQGGSRVELGGKTYHFIPTDANDPEAPHVAEVTDEAHIKRLLSIDCYRGLGKEGAAVQAQVQAALQGSGTEGHIKSPAEMDADVVSEETIHEILAELDNLMAKAKKESPDQLTNKQISDFAEEHIGISPTSKRDINRFAAGCEIEIRGDLNQPAAMLRDLLVKLSAKYPPEDEADDEGDGAENAGAGEEGDGDGQE